MTLTLCNRSGKTAPVVERLCEVPAVALRLAFGLFLAFVMFPFLLLGGGERKHSWQSRGGGGGSVTGVKVTLVNQETNTKQEAVTAEDGRFSITDLTPGTYLLQIEASAFEPYKTNIQVGTEKLNPLKINLKLRTIEEEITVHPAAADDRLSPETNTDSMKIDETFFSGLPLEVDYLLPSIDTFTNPQHRGAKEFRTNICPAEAGRLRASPQG